MCIRDSSRAELAYQSMIEGLSALEHLAEFAHKLTYLPVVTREDVYKRQEPPGR